jgi:hypothetical protein
MVFLASLRLMGAPPLAYQLQQEGQFRLSALEFRRLALETDSDLAAANGHWFAAYSYFRNGDWNLAETQLDYAEDLIVLELEEPVLWLRAQLAAKRRDWDAASIYYEDLAASSNSRWRDHALRGQVVSALHRKEFDNAERLAQNLSSEIAKQVTEYRQKPAKRPKLGGLLGTVPGLGYAYSGEYGNAVRSLLLNSLFIWGMVETAQDDHWAVFSVLTFFELTWYSGSIYGGIDAAHRYNRENLTAVGAAIQGSSAPRPKAASIPLLSIEFEW